MGPKTRQAMALARDIALIQGFEPLSPSFRVDMAEHPRAKLIWAMAKLAYEHLRFEDIDEVIAEEDEAQQPSAGEGG